VTPATTSKPTTRNGTRIPAGEESVKFALIPFERIGDSLREDWREIRQSCSTFRSPFFSYSFHELVSRLNPGVELACMQQGGRTRAILPLRRDSVGRAKPVGGGINDVHGLLCMPGFEVPFPEFLRRAGLRNYAFHAMPTGAHEAEVFEMGRTRSYLADLTVDPDGYEAFLVKRNRTIGKQAQKTRKLGREVGELTFEFQSLDKQVMQRLILLKRKQYQRTHTFDIFSVTWIEQLLFALQESNSGELQGALSVLRAGGEPVAMHFGIREGDLLHYWFPVYDPAFHFGSPGTQLFLDVARACSQLGIEKIDMGYGEQAYKHKLTNVITEMSYGLVEANPLRRATYRWKQQFEGVFKGSRIRELLKPYARKAMPGFGGGKYSG
jgi:CelD/BcsL family acetyltransferase involved in cellulose biosynthesis